MADQAALKQGQWAKVLDAVVGCQATWVADIGLRGGLFAAGAVTTAAVTPRRRGGRRSPG
jgi:hypothetical protein